MFRASVLLLLLSCGAVLGCVNGSTAQNVSTTGWKAKSWQELEHHRAGSKFNHRYPGKYYGTTAKTAARRTQTHAKSRQRLISYRRLLNSKRITISELGCSWLKVK